MHTTMALLSRALQIKTAAAWARDLNVTESALSQARKRGRLSPQFAGIIASEIGEDPVQWTATAAIEAEPDGPLKDRLLKRIRKL